MLTVNIGVQAMAYSSLVSCIFCQIINSWPNKKLLNYSYLAQLRDIFPNIILAMIMGVLVYPVSAIGFPPVITLIIQVPLGIVIYVLG